MSFLVWKSIENWTILLSKLNFIFKRPGFSEFPLVSILLCWLFCNTPAETSLPTPMVLSVTLVWWPWNVAFAGKWSDGICISGGYQGFLSPAASWKEGRIPHLYLKAADATTSRCSSAWLYPQRSVRGQHPTARQIWKSWAARGALPALPQRAKQLNFGLSPPLFSNYYLSFRLKVMDKTPRWCTQVLRRAPRSKCLCLMQLTHLFT